MSEILHWKEVKTRKPHRCFGCQKTYPAGTEMTHAAYADGGSVDGCYWCETCVEYMARYFEPGDETGQGEIYYNGPEQWDALNAERRRKKHDEGR